MPDEKKPESPGPVVIRKGVVTPLPPEQPRAAGASPGGPPPAEKEDLRPLWQRVAESARPAGARAPGARRHPRTGGGPGRDRKPRGAPRGGEGPGREGAARDDAGTAPPSPPGAPPPAPEMPIPDEGTFADLLAGSGKGSARSRYEVGEKVAGKIIQIGHDVAFLELGSGVADGMIDISELKDESGAVVARIGDIIDGVVVKGGERGVLVSRGRGHGRSQRDREALMEAARTGLPVEGVVKSVNKGGLEVEVHGQRAFCPVSQIDLKFVADPSSFVGQRLQFKVQRADARDAVLSRRALLEEERAERARKTREALAEGAVFEGTVTSVQDYGAFVDIGGVEGLIHVSELSWDRVSRPSDLLSPGDGVRVQVLKVEQDAKKGERISLSVKSLSPKPESAEPATQGGAEAPRPPSAPPPRPKVGDVVKATVDKVEPYGVFVRFAGGRGLVPASETGTPRGTDLRRAFKPGDEMDCAVSAIDEQGRFRLSRTEAEAAAERKEAQEYMRRAAPQGKGKGFGTLGDLLREKLRR